MRFSTLNNMSGRGLREDALVFLALAILFFTGAVFLNARYDDAYIAYRYAENIANGHGPVYNLGERVEGYTCILWLLILAAVSKLGLSVVRMSVAFGIGFGWLTIAATSWLAYQVSGEDARWRRWLPSLFVAFCPFFAFSAGTGIETALATCLATTALGFVLYERDRVYAPFLFGLASLARPDTVLYAGVAFLYDLRVRKLKKALLRTLPLLVLFGGQIVFRLVYYGEILPNIYYSKVGFSVGVLLRGMRYTLAFLRAWWYLPLLGIVALFVFSKNRLKYGLLLAVVAVHTAYIIRVGGDFMRGLRFFMPITPVVLVLITESLIGLTERIRRVESRLLCRLASFALILAVMASQVQAAVNARDSVRRFNRRKMGAAQYFLQKLPADSLIATDAIGIIGYFTKMPILDVLGTVDRHIAHAKVPMGRGLAGHEKYDADYIFERHPDVIYIPVSAKGRFVILPVWTKIWEHPLLHERYEVVRDTVPYYCRRNTETKVPPDRNRSGTY